MFDKIQKRIIQLIHWRIRLVPIVIFCTFLVLSVKITHVIDHLTTPSLDVSWTDAGAQSPPPKAPLTMLKSDAETLIDVPEKREIATFDPLNMTPEEFRTLQELAKRKSDLTSNTMGAVNQKSDNDAVKKLIAEKTKEHTKAKNELKSMLDKVDHEESVGIKRLIKMTESMKPKEAAPILEGVDFSILIQIMEGIKEGAASKILSQMDPKKASYLLTEMGRRKQILAKKN